MSTLLRNLEPKPFIAAMDISMHAFPLTNHKDPKFSVKPLFPEHGYITQKRLNQSHS